MNEPRPEQAQPHWKLFQPVPSVMPVPPLYGFWADSWQDACRLQKSGGMELIPGPSLTWGREVSPSDQPTWLEAVSGRWWRPRAPSPHADSEPGYLTVAGLSISVPKSSLKHE